MVKIEFEDFKNYGRVAVISNGIIEAFVTLDVGPRIIRFGFVGAKNLLCDERYPLPFKDDEEFQAFFGKGKKWELLGGHRLWTSPESYPQTYYPDMEPVRFEITENGAVFIPKAEKENGIQKEIEIIMNPKGTSMRVIMRVTNIAEEPKEFSAWGLTVMNKGGTLVIPMNTKDTGLLPNRNISVWAYTDLADNRLRFFKHYVTLRQDVNAETPLKLGFNLDRAEVYYCLGDDVFKKSYDTFHESEKYPDNNCSFETYTSERFLEVESLSPLKCIGFNETLTLSEEWSIHKIDGEIDFTNEEEIEKMLNKI